MKKTMTPRMLAAAAMLLCAAGAQAQNVQIYGLIDLAVERLTDVGAAGSSVTRMPGLTGSAPSRLGFRGSEDLGGGLKALFTLEAGLGVDTGTSNQGGRFFGRQSFVGLQGPWGTVSLGRQYSMLFWSQLDADLLGPNAYGSGSMDSYLPNARVDNALAWRGTFGPLTAGATYSPGRDAVNAGPSPAGTNCAGESATDSQACRQWSALLKYDAGPWGMTAAVDQIRGGTGAFAGLTSSTLTDTRSTVTGWWRVNTDLKLGAGLISRKNEGSATTPRSDLWYLGASWKPAPLWTVDAEVFKLDVKNSPNGATLLAVRGSYALSKNTALYATVGHIGNDGASALGVSNAAAGNAPAAGRGQTGAATGVRMAF
ncbi:porin [Aquabacterium sp. OR-4]|uniref:porin n=1 Tax=Aquabacterium sp. OR-4 TaxID=2978127 RepID=UPI0021B1CF1B|nr:porin [Aquabacterium sp. OR-4]MDT7838026.1 porin [Aquabacterium sp. OR-4]